MSRKFTLRVYTVGPEIPFLGMEPRGSAAETQKEHRRLREASRQVRPPAGISPHPEVHTLNPGACRQVSPHRGDSADVIKVKSLEIGRLPWIIWVGLIDPKNARERWESGSGRETKEAVAA